MSLATASATLARATRFLGARQPIEGANGTKVIGNGLRELDRFLAILIDEVAADAAPAGLDLARLARVRNTPNKLRLLQTALALPSPDHSRLRAIGRGRACLFHTGGVVRRTDTRHAAQLTTGWTARPYARGETLRITPAHLADICGFYDRLAAELVAATGQAVT